MKKLPPSPLFSTSASSNLPINDFLAALNNSAPASGSNPAGLARPPLHHLLPSTQPPSTDLEFKANAPVGIHFKWANNAYRVVGFTENSPAKEQKKIEEGCTLLSVNSVSLHNVPQSVVNQMMKECAAQDRVLTFTLPKPKIMPSMQQSLQRVASRAKSKQLLKKSHIDDTSTPARRMRIVYEFCKPLILKYQKDGIAAALVKMRQIAAASVIQRSFRGFLDRKFFRAAMKIRKHTAIICVQKSARRRLAVKALQRLRLQRKLRVENEAATKIGATFRMKLAMLLLLKLKARRDERIASLRDSAATKIQALARKRPKESAFRAVRVSSEVIQARARGKFARTFVVILRMKMRCATKVQAEIRRIKAVAAARKRKDSILMIQTLIRMRLAKKKLDFLRDEIMAGNDAEVSMSVSSPSADDDNNICKQPNEEALEVSVSSQLEESTPLSPSKMSPANSPAQTASPEQPVWQLRFSPDTGSCLQTNELFGTESASPSKQVHDEVHSVSPKSAVLTPPLSPETPMEEKFRREREKREGVAKDKLARALQARQRGISARRQIAAMYTIGRALSRLSNVARCKKVVKRLLWLRNRAAVAIQRRIRITLSLKKVREVASYYCATLRG